jgi:hypothetical protein
MLAVGDRAAVAWSGWWLLLAAACYVLRLWPRSLLAAKRVATQDKWRRQSGGACAGGLRASTR